MKEVTLKCRVITPLFMGGADMEPEIRTQSIKGLIRFWWRALKSHSNIQELKKEEYSIFGGSAGDKAVSSEIKIAISINKLSKGTDVKTENNLKWLFNKNNRSLEGEHNGMGYLWYSVLQRQYIKQDSFFTIKLQSRDENILKQTLMALWCAIYLGGFGARSRRGAGSIIVDEIDGNVNNISINFKPVPDSNINNITYWYKSNLKSVLKIINIKRNNNCKYSNLINSKIIISQNNFNNWIDALNDIGKKYSDFRLDNRRQIFKSAIFGLPIIHRNGKVLTNNKEIKRRSSPIMFKVIKYNGRYYWLSLLLGGNFLPDNVQISFNNQSQPPDFSFINEFWNNIKQNNTEIILQEVFNA